MTQKYKKSHPIHLPDTRGRWQRLTSFFFTRPSFHILFQFYTLSYHKKIGIFNPQSSRYDLIRLARLFTFVLRFHSAVSLESPNSPRQVEWKSMSFIAILVPIPSSSSSTDTLNHNPAIRRDNKVKEQEEKKNLSWTRDLVVFLL